MNKLLLITALIFSGSVFAELIEYKLEKEEQGKTTQIFTFQVDENDKNYYHKEGKEQHETYPVSKQLPNGEYKKDYEVLKLENYFELKVLDDIMEFNFKDERKKESLIPRTIETSANVMLDLKNVNKERKSMLKVDDIEFFISVTEK